MKNRFRFFPQFAVGHPQVVVDRSVFGILLYCTFQKVTRRKVGSFVEVDPSERVRSTGRIRQYSPRCLGVGKGNVVILPVRHHKISQVIGSDRLRSVNLQRLLVILDGLNLIPLGLFEHSQHRDGCSVLGMSSGPLVPGPDRLVLISECCNCLRIGLNCPLIRRVQFHCLFRTISGAAIVLCLELQGG